MIKEFCNITGANKEDIEEKWSVITTKVLKYSRMETRKPVKKLITRLILMNILNKKTIVVLNFSVWLLIILFTFTADRTASYVLMLLAALLLKGNSRIAFYTLYEVSLCSYNGNLCSCSVWNTID